MEVTHEQIIDAHRRFTEAQWRLNVENKRTDEKIKWIILHSQRLHEYQDRLRVMNEISRQQAEKLRLVYKRIELHGQISAVKEGLKKAKQLTARAEGRVNKVYDDLESMEVERWELGLEEDVNNNSVFGSTSSDEMEVSVEAVQPISQGKTECEKLILKRIDEASTRVRIANEKCASLEKRKLELIDKIENYKNRKKDAVKARLALREKNQNASLKLYFVEFGEL